MKVTTQKKLQIKVILEEEEAEWLVDYLRNFVGREEEDHKDYTNRVNLFNCLQKELNHDQ